MPKSEIAVTHRLKQEEALKRIKTLLSKVKEKHGKEFKILKEEWKLDKCDFSISVSAKGAPVAVSGTLIVGQSEVKLSAEYPITATPFKGMVESELKKQAQALLA